MKTLHILIIGMVLSTQPNAEAQFGRSLPNREQDRICFYKDIQYQGMEQCYRPGDEVATLQNQRNTVSSIRIYGRARVTVYDETNFRGHLTQFESNAPDLGQVNMEGSRSWNDKIESFRVESAFGAYGNAPVYRGGPWDQRTVDDGICVYDRANYEGRSECWTGSENLFDLAREGDWSDNISSIRVFGRARAIAYRDIEFRGEDLIIDRDIPDLRQVSARSFRNWDRQISSLRVQTRRGGFNDRDRDFRRFGRR